MEEQNELTGSSNANSSQESFRVKYDFTWTVEEGKDGKWVPKKRIQSTCLLNTNSLRKTVAAATCGAIDGICAKIFNTKLDEDSSNQDPLEDPNNPEENLDDSPEEE